MTSRMTSRMTTMTKLITFVVLGNFVTMASCILASRQMPFHIAEGHLNKELTTHTLFNFKDVESIHDCTKTCMFTPRCQSVSFHRVAQTCLLHRVNSSVVNTDDFLIVNGSVFATIGPWSNIVHGCINNTCMEYEQCLPVESGHVCRNASAEVCKKDPTLLKCYKHYHNMDKIGTDMRVYESVTSTLQCFEICLSLQPTFMCLLVNLWSMKCYCKRQSVRDYLKKGGKLTKLHGGHRVGLYDRLWD